MIRRQGASIRRIALLVGLAVVGSCLGPVAAQADLPGWRLIGATGPTNLPPVTSEVQSLAIDAEGGTYTLTFEGQTTAPIQWDAAASEVAIALKALPAIGASGVIAGGGPGNPGAELPYFVSFRGPLAGVDVPEITADGSGLTGAGASVTVETETSGSQVGEGKLAAYPTNVGGATATGPVTMTIGPLPDGIETAAGASGVEWTCPGSGPGQDEVVCTWTTPLPEGATASPVVVPLRIDGELAATESTVSMSVSGGGAADAYSYTQPVVVSATPALPGVQALWAGAFNADAEPETRAGAHPHSATTGFLLNTVLSARGLIQPAGNIRDVHVDLPPGFIGNPLVTQRCPQEQLTPGAGGSELCGPNEVVAEQFNTVFQRFDGGEYNPATPKTPIYNDMPPEGYAAEFSTLIGIPIQSLLASVRSDEDYGVRVTAPNIKPQYTIYGSFVTLQGEPAAAGGKAFLTNPTRCSGSTSLVTRLQMNSWTAPQTFAQSSAEQPPITECDLLSFEPGFSFVPSTQSAATGAGATAILTVDQEGLLDPEAKAPAHLKRSVVTLPVGLALNPSAADGLEACSTQQMGMRGTNYSAPNPIRFDMDPVSCPDGSKIGTVEVRTPLLEDPLEGTIFLATQGDNPFNSLLAVYLVVDDAKTGTVLKLPGEVRGDSVTGQLTATFDNNPQLPFTALDLQFRGGGPRSTMATPDVCGKYTTNGSFTPWSAPESGPPAQSTDSFDITTGVGGGACPATKAQRPFALGFEAGTTDAVAGGHSPFTLRITRPDGNQELNTINVDMPMGLTATLKGVVMCSDASLAVAGAAGRTGKTEMATPSCPASSQVGTTTIGAGVGSQPFYVKTGKVYLTGPYKGAPLGLAFIVPAVAGPFDLGVQVVRTALNVNPETAKITAVSDPIPQILEGIPLQIRDVRVDVDRPGFTLNPTNCEEMAVSGQVTGGSGAVANVGNRFQVGNCSALGFKPQLNLKLSGGTRRDAHPKLRAELKQPAGQANIGGVSVVLPRTQFIDQDRIGNVCTRPQFAAEACPKSSILGNAVAYTPLLDEPLRGKVYFRANGGERELPDMVVDLKGQVPVVLVGYIDSVGKKGSEVSRIRNRFAVVPDAPVTKFVLNLKGGKEGLLVNSTDICAKKFKATVKMKAHNGMARNFSPVIKNDCGKKKSKKAKKSTKSPRANAPWYTQNFAD